MSVMPSTSASRGFSLDEWQLLLQLLQRMLDNGDAMRLPVGAA